MSANQTQPGRKTVLPNPLLIKVELDPDKLAKGRGVPNTYFTARQTAQGASGPLNALAIVPSGLPTGVKAGVIGRRSENKLAVK